MFFRQNQGNKIFDTKRVGVTKILYLCSAFRICTGCLLKYKWNLLKIDFKNTYFHVFTGISSYSSIQPNQPNSGQIWVNFGQTGPFLKFPPKSENLIIFRLQRLCFEQKIRKFRCAFLEKNAKNLHFWSFRPKRAILDSFWPKW